MDLAISTQCASLDAYLSCLKFCYIVSSHPEFLCLTSQNPPSRVPDNVSCTRWTQVPATSAIKIHLYPALIRRHPSCVCLQLGFLVSAFNSINGMDYQTRPVASHPLIPVCESALVVGLIVCTVVCNLNDCILNFPPQEVS